MRSDILSMLRNAGGNYVSGEQIAKTLQVSRTAIWKHINELKLAGYLIESHSRSGYCLRETPDLLLPQEIQNGLQTKCLGHAIKYFTDTVSTNNEAKILAANGAPEGMLVVSEAQNAGRGRLSRGWYSPSYKGIWFSVILRPAFLPQEAPKCTLMAAVAIVMAIKKCCGIDVGIKWPNDILYKGKKLVGILTEMSAEMDQINHIVIGTGINVNLSREDFPEELQEIATSLSMINGREIDRLPLLQTCLLEMENLYTVVNKQGFSSVLELWKKNSVTLGQQVRVIGIKESFSGEAVDIDSDGALLVRTGNEIQRVLAGDVSIRPQK